MFQYNILNNVLERNSRSSESLNFISLKNYILETKVFEGKIAKTDPHKKRNFFKNGRLSAICYTEINLKNIRQMHFLGVFLHEGRENFFLLSFTLFFVQYYQSYLMFQFDCKMVFGRSTCLRPVSKVEPRDPPGPPQFQGPPGTPVILLDPWEPLQPPGPLGTPKIPLGPREFSWYQGIPRDMMHEKDFSEIIGFS